jgi:hypothetical protein
MEGRGRRSAASLAVVSSSAIEITERPAPPSDLSAEQKVEWVSVINRMPADWFPRETHGMLAQYCRHVVAARRVAQLIAAAEADEEFNVKDYDRLLKMQEREGRAITSLATKMRLSQQSSYDKSKKKPSTTRKPWEG